MDIYLSLSYDDYKEMEAQFANYPKMETTHDSTEGYYHKAFRLKVGDVKFEFHGPLVKAPRKG